MPSSSCCVLLFGMLYRSMLAERKALKENSPLTDRLLGKVVALHWGWEDWVGDGQVNMHILQIVVHDRNFALNWVDLKLSIFKEKYCWGKCTVCCMWTLWWEAVFRLQGIFLHVKFLMMLDPFLDSAEHRQVWKPLPSHAGRFLRLHLLYLTMIKVKNFLNLHTQPENL